MSELNGTSPRGDRRIRWKTSGAAITAVSPRTYSGARKLTEHLLVEVHSVRPGRRLRRIRAFRRSNRTSSSGRSVVIDSYSIPRSTQDRSRSAGMHGKLSQVTLACRRRVDVKLSARFDVVKHRRCGEREIHFRRVEDPQHDDIVPARTQVS